MKHSCICKTLDGAVLVPDRSLLLGIAFYTDKCFFLNNYVIDEFLGRN